MNTPHDELEAREAADAARSRLTEYASQNRAYAVDALTLAARLQGVHALKLATRLKELREDGYVAEDTSCAHYRITDRIQQVAEAIGGAE